MFETQFQHSVLISSTVAPVSRLLDCLISSPIFCYDEQRCRNVVKLTISFPGCVFIIFYHSNSNPNNMAYSPADVAGSLFGKRPGSGSSIRSSLATSCLKKIESGSHFQ